MIAVRVAEGLPADPLTPQQYHAPALEHGRDGGSFEIDGRRWALAPSEPRPLTC